MANTNVNKTLTIKDIIKRKDQIKAKRNARKSLYVESLDGEIVVVAPDRDLCIDAMDMEGSSGDNYIVYNCVVEPNLTDKELHEAYGVAEPTDIVECIFNMGEITSIATELMKMAGVYSTVKVVEDIKN